MPTLEKIDVALATLSLKHGVGTCKTNPGVQHYVLIPDYDEEFVADDTDYFTFENVNIEFYLDDNYRSIVKTARTLLKAAGIFVLDGHYVEFDQNAKLHHYALPVVGEVEEET